MSVSCRNNQHFFKLTMKTIWMSVVHNPDELLCQIKDYTSQCREQNNTYRFQFLISFIQEVKLFFRSFIAWWKPEKQSRVFTSSRILTFLQAMKARRTCFISFIKLLFSDKTKGKMINEVCMYSFISSTKL